MDLQFRTREEWVFQQARDTRDLSDIIAPNSPRSPVVIAHSDPFQITFLDVAIEVDCYIRFHPNESWSAVYFYALHERNDILKNIRRKKQEAQRRDYEVKNASTEAARQAAIRKVENEKRVNENTKYLSARFQQAVDCADDAFARAQDPISASVKATTCFLKKLREPLPQMYNNGNSPQCGTVMPSSSKYAPSCNWNNL